MFCCFFGYPMFSHLSSFDIVVGVPGDLKNQGKLFEELRMYHRKDGKIVPANDDVISAMRYAVMSLRKARTKTYERLQTQSDYEFNIFN